MTWHWKWYWPQSVEIAAASLQGYATREEAIKAAHAEESRLRALWGPGKATP